MNQNQIKKLSFVVVEDKSPVAHVLRVPAKILTFPLSAEDKEDLDILTAKFFATENCAGLAAPQIGIGKSMIIYSVDEEVKNYRSDVDEVIKPRVLINPSYMPHLEKGKRIDWEACFSVSQQYGEVPRFIEIEYQGFDPEGNLIHGIARGFHARLLQHEIGHLNGQLFIDLFEPGCRHGPFEEMRAIRMKELKERQK